MFQPFPKQAVAFTCLEYKCFEKAVGKGEIVCKMQFHPPVLFAFSENFPPCSQISYCCLQTLSVWKSMKFVIWEMVK